MLCFPRSRWGPVAVVVIAAACVAQGSPGPTGDGSPGPTATDAPRAMATPAPAVTAAPTETPVHLPASGEWARLLVDGPVPAAREAHTWTVDAAAGVAYLFGGRDGGTIFDDLWRFDLRAERWDRLQPSGSVPPARFGHNAVWLEGTGPVVFAGQSKGGFFNDLWAFDPASASWSRLPAGGSAPIPRYGSCAALGTDGRLWISHGFTEDRARFADTRAYDFVGGTWSDETPRAGDLPIARCLHACFLAADGDFVLYGGQTTGTLALGDLWSLDFATRLGPIWMKLDEPLPPARNLTAFAPAGGALVTFGGGALAGGYLDDTWAFSLADLSSASVDTSGGPPPARSGASLVTDDVSGRLLLFGGRNTKKAFDDLWSLELR